MEKNAAKAYLAQYVGLKTENDAIEQMWDQGLRDQLTPRWEANKRKLDEIHRAVDMIEDPLQRTVLYIRYFNCPLGRLTTWPDVAIQLYGGDDEAKMIATRRLYNKALEALCRNPGEAVITGEKQAETENRTTIEPREKREFFRSFFTKSSVKGN